jgi:predicted nucleic acid-binding protein
MVASLLASMVDAETAATCITVDLEVGYSARSLTNLEQIQRLRRDRFIALSINDVIEEHARTIQRRMAAIGLHRGAGVADLLTAAVAAFHGATLVHYDSDFELIARVTSQPHQWVVPQGSVD